MTRVSTHLGRQNLKISPLTLELKFCKRERIQLLGAEKLQNQILRDRKLPLQTVSAHATTAWSCLATYQSICHGFEFYCFIVTCIVHTLLMNTFLEGYVGERPWWPIQNPNMEKGRKRKAERRERSDQAY